MSKLKYVFYILILALLVISCKDEESNPVEPWESAVHGYAKFANGSPTDFTAGDLSKMLDLNYQWVSIDNANTVNKIEFYITFSEPYTDLENNPRTANHGTKLFRVVEGAQVPGNRSNINFKITQEDILNLFKDEMFDYGNGPVNVLSRAPRTAAMPLTKRDNFNLTWALTTDDGRYFDSWSNSTCTEFETYRGTLNNDGGFNCVVIWEVE